MSSSIVLTLITICVALVTVANAAQLREKNTACDPLRRLLRQIELQAASRETWVCLRAHLRGQQMSGVSTATGDRLLQDMGESDAPKSQHLTRLAQVYDAELERLQQRHVERAPMPDGAARLVAQYHLRQTLRHSPYLLDSEREGSDDDAVNAAWRSEVDMRRFLREPSHVTQTALARLRMLSIDNPLLRAVVEAYDEKPTPRLLKALKEAWNRHELGK